MSKFLVIFIAAILILSLFLTVNSFGDKFESGGSNSSTTTVPNTSMTSPTSSSQPDSNFYLDSSGEYGYSIVDGFCYFFAKADIPSYGKIMRVEVSDFSTYTHKVRFSSDGKTWLTADDIYYGSGRYEYHISTLNFIGGFAYVSYCAMPVSDSSEALAICEDIFPIDEKYFDIVCFDNIEGDLPGAEVE